MQFLRSSPSSAWRRSTYPFLATLTLAGVAAQSTAYAQNADTATVSSPLPPQLPEIPNVAPPEATPPEAAQPMAPLVAPDDSLEPQWVKLPAGLQSMLPDIAATADFALAVFSEDPVAGGGHDPASNGFHLQALELWMGGNVDPYFRFDTNLVFAPDGVEIEEVYGTALAIPGGFQLRAGQFLTRIGRHNTQHLHSWELANQPIALTRLFGPEGNRGLGAELSWLTPLPWYVELVYSGTDARGDETNRSFAPENLEIDSPFDFEHVIALKQFFELSDDWSLAMGLAAATGPNGNENRHNQIYAGDVYLKYRPISRQSTFMVSLATEWFYRRRNFEAQTSSDWASLTQAVIRFAPRWSLAIRHELTSDMRNDVVIVVDPGTDVDLRLLQLRQRFGTALTFYPTEFSRLRLQGEADRFENTHDVVYAGFLTLEVLIGAHAAHNF